ncbi:topoisomerase 1-associated factor 1 [Kwoniella heveanensis CBS 569]|nr:topoisomerase 1-associated factor 1 [Kwoniella heveanensis CBS 569]
MSETLSPLRDGPSRRDYDDLERLYDDVDDDRLGSPSREFEDPTDRYEIFLPAVQALVAALGGYEEVETSPGSGEYETIYRPGDSVLAVLKDLKKLWRKDDEDDERTVARCMAKAGLMRELVAILVECTDRGDWGRKVALVACDLIAALTWPIDVASELKEMEDEPDVVTDYASLLRAQVEYKATILQSSGPLRCLLALMLPSLAKPRKDEKHQRVISLGLHVVRNLLAIKDTLTYETSFHEQSNLILQLNKLTYFQLVLTLASCADKTDFNPFNVLVLDILHLVFRSVKPADLGRDQAKAPGENLAKLLDAEKRQKALVSKVGMTRHSRFGTTVAVRAGEQKVILHKQNAISANAGKILDEVKRKRKPKIKRVDDLTQIVNLSPDAMRVLQTLAKSFIQSCFNTFFASILKDIRMERSKIRPTDNLRTFFLSRFFIEYLLVLHEKEAAQGAKKHELALGLVAEMVEMDNIRWLFYRLKSAMDDKPPAWTELQASLDCFTQILLLLDEMAASKNEEDVDVAEIVQNNLYYNGDILDSSLSVISQYKDQSVAYLDSVIHFAYVLLRMLEKFSKNKAFMFIRKKKAARKKRQQNLQNPAESSGMPEEYGNEEEEALGPDQEAPSYAEHAFTFQAFEKRFASEAVTNTLLAYLARFQEFEEPEQMKRVVGLMHRQVIKAQAEGLYFKVSTLNLFRTILDEQHTLIKADSSKDLMQLINFVLRKFFKRVAEDPFLIIEAFTSKSRSKWKDLSSYKSEDEDEDGMGGQRARIKEKMGLAELEFKKNKNLSWSQQMEVAVSLILKEEHADWIKWIIEELEVALAARTEIVLSVDGEEALITHNDEDEDEDGEGVRRKFGGPSKEAVEKFAQHDLKTETEELRTAVTKNAHFRLILKLLSFDMVRPSDEALAAEPIGPLYSEWYLPSTVLPSNISTSLGAVKQYLENPPHLTEDPKDLLRRARPPARKKQHRESSPSLSDMELDSDTGELVRRVKKARKRKTKAAEMQTFKSAAFIEDSDDEDESVSARFFEKEQQLREEMRRLAEEQGNVMRRHGTRQKRKRGKKGEDDQRGGEEAEDMEVDVAGSDDSDWGLKRNTQAGLGQNQDVVNAEESDIDTLGDENEDDDVVAPRARKRQSLATRDRALTQEVTDDDEAEESDKQKGSPSPPPATSKANGKARRVVDSDEENEV